MKKVAIKVAINVLIFLLINTTINIIGGLDEKIEKNEEIIRKAETYIHNKMLKLIVNSNERILLKNVIFHCL